MINLKGLVLVSVVLFAVASASPKPEPEEPQCEKTDLGLWNNLVTNLDRMFLQPFMDEYRYVRYATSERPLHAITSGLENATLPTSCDQLGVTSYFEVLCVQLSARTGLQWPCSGLATPKLALALATLDECPLQTQETEKALIQGLNRTLQRRQHCYYATRVLRCSLLNLYWVLPVSLAVGVVALPVLLVLALVAWLSWCCRSRDPYQ